MHRSFFRVGLALVLGLTAPAAVLSGCTHAEQREAAADTTAAYTDFKAHVERIESRVSFIDLSDTQFSEEMNSAQADFDAKLAVVERDAEQLSAEQRADVAALKTRYTTAVEQRRAAYAARTTTPAATAATNGAAPLYQSAAAGYANLTAADLRATYERFVQNVKANEDRYGIADWRVVNEDWKALNARKDQLEDHLSVADRAEIAKEKVKYAAFKTFDKAEARAAQGADETESGAYRAGQAIGRGANKAGQAIDRGAEKVGDAAKEVFRGVKDAGKEATRDTDGDGK